MSDDGQKLMLDGRWTEAAAHYNAVVTTAPGDVAAWTHLGVALLQLGYAEAAVDAFRRGLAVRADFGPALANLGVALQRQGQVVEAIEAYCAAIAVQPHNAQLFVNLGNALIDAGRRAEAMAAHQRALELRQVQPAADGQRENGQRAGQRDKAVELNTTGNDHFAAGRAQAALDAYAQALGLWPDYADAQGNLGNALRSLGRLGDAVAAYRRAVELAPDDAGHWCNLSMALQASGASAEAADMARRALALRPDMALAHACLGVALRDLKELEAAIGSLRQALALDGGLSDAIHALSGCLVERQRWDEVEALGRQALARDPRSVDARVCLAVALQGQNRLEEALDTARQALELQPGSELALGVMAAALHGLDRSGEAIAAAVRGLSVAPDNADLHNTLGVVLLDAGRVADAQVSLRRAIARKPDFVTAHVNLGMACLQMGQLEEGWAEYEWRLREGHETRLWDVMPERAWQRGEDLTGRTLTLHTEQGMGDLIQFSRYADRRWWGGPGRSGPPARIVLRTPRGLAELVSSVPGVDGLLVDDEVPATCDVHAPLLSLPHMLGTTLATVPAATPYMTPPAAALARWRAWFAAEDGGAGLSSPGLRVGLVWSGNPGHKGDRHRSIHQLAALNPLWTVPGVRWYSLQVGPRAGDVGQMPAGRVKDLSAHLTDYSETAAVIANLDLVVAVDTSVAHLAGALGKPVWLLISNRPDWRWMRDRTDSPWYPTARLFRQTRMNDWSGPMAAMAAALAELAARHSVPASRQQAFRRLFGV
ncbi:tetratricopeptide repeat protein [Nitrospirillum sp. BR 11163]|uniref:tetratricopeptide repeat protein n=1 Tax=Nitrospirillum sp. BR 11163 TaxID=3104323 RepID=UPI002B002B2C|nr:tetratricopeptide repeat protein [Nitrospirillum sp. BR 11163]MEA1675738.1 tetratricopeptide repeat protein [Nitrospirillum sp. BR 11163]